MASPINSKGIEAALVKPDVPPGITKDFLQQSRDQPAVIAILFVLSFVTVIVALRVYARSILVRRLGADDILVLASMVCTT